VATRGYVLVETAVGKTRDVVDALQAVGGITAVDAVTGPYDIIAVVEADDLNAVGDLVTGSIHPVNGIVRTVTCLSISVR